MSYTRYSPTSDWYIFARVALGSDEALLAVWHKDFRKDAPEFSLGEIQRMLELNNFSCVPGFSPEAETLLKTAFEEFVADEASDNLNQ